MITLNEEQNNVNTLTIIEETVKPLSPLQLATVDAEARFRGLVDKAIDRARKAAAFDLGIEARHEPSALFDYAGSQPLMFALYNLYTARQDELRAEAAHGC